MSTQVRKANYERKMLQQRIDTIQRKIITLDLIDIDNWSYEDFVGRFIRLFPNDSVWKWGVIKAANQHGIMVVITYVKLNGFHSNYSIGDCHFVPWSKATFHFCSQSEAKNI